MNLKLVESWMMQLSVNNLDLEIGLQTSIIHTSHDKNIGSGIVGNNKKCKINNDPNISINKA